MKRRLPCSKARTPIAATRPWLSKKRDAFHPSNNAHSWVRNFGLVTNWITNNMPDTHARMRLFFPAWCVHMKAVPMPNETRASARARSLQTSATDLSTSRKRCNFRYLGHSKIILAFEPIEIRRIDFGLFPIPNEVKCQSRIDLALFEENWFAHLIKFCTSIILQFFTSTAFSLQVNKKKFERTCLWS